MFGDTIGTFLWDRLCVALFARNVFKASMEEFKRLSIQDFLPILKTAGLAIIGVFIVSTNNILFIGIGCWYYFQYYMKPKGQPGLL